MLARWSSSTPGSDLFPTSEICGYVRKTPPPLKTTDAVLRTSKANIQAACTESVTLPCNEEVLAQVNKHCDPVSLCQPCFRKITANPQSCFASWVIQRTRMFILSHETSPHRSKGESTEQPWGVNPYGGAVLTGPMMVACQWNTETQRDRSHLQLPKAILSVVAKPISRVNLQSSPTGPAEQ